MYFVLRTTRLSYQDARCTLKRGSPASHAHRIRLPSDVACAILFLSLHRIPGSHQHNRRRLVVLEPHHDRSRRGTGGALLFHGFAQRGAPPRPHYSRDCDRCDCARRLISVLPRRTRFGSVAHQSESAALNRLFVRAVQRGFRAAASSVAALAPRGRGGRSCCHAWGCWGYWHPRRRLGCRRRPWHIPEARWTMRGGGHHALDHALRRSRSCTNRGGMGTGGS